MSLPATLDMRQHGSSPSDMETEQGPTDQTRDGRHTVRDKHDSGFTLSTTETKLEKENDNNDPGSVTDSQTFDQKRIVDWDGPDDPDHPLNWCLARKIRITIVTAVLTLVASLGSSIFSAVVQLTAVRFNTSVEVMILGVSLYVVGFACGMFCRNNPKNWSNLTDV